MRPPRPAELRAFLRRLQEAVAAHRAQRLVITVVRTAQLQAAEDLGWTTDDVIDFLASLQLVDFHRRELSTAGSGVIWTFEPYLDDDLMWLRIVEDGTSWRVISCHLSEVTGEARFD